MYLAICCGSDMDDSTLARAGCQSEGLRKRCQSRCQLECGQMPNVMVALPNTGGALCSTPQSLADAHYWSAVQ